MHLAKNYPTVLFWDTSTFDRRKYRNKVRTSGVSDLQGIILTDNGVGRPLAIEIKTSNGNLRECQKNFLSEFAMFGGLSIVARDIEDLDIKLRKGLILLEDNKREGVFLR